MLQIKRSSNCKNIIPYSGLSPAIKKAKKMSALKTSPKSDLFVIDDIQEIYIKLQKFLLSYIIITLNL